MDFILGKVSKTLLKKGSSLTSLSICSVEAMTRPPSRSVVSIQEGWGDRFGATAQTADPGKSAMGIAAAQIALDHVLNDRPKDPERKGPAATPS
jgi:hypothetical protein